MSDERDERQPEEPAEPRAQEQQGEQAEDLAPDEDGGEQVVGGGGRSPTYKNPFYD